MRVVFQLVQKMTRGRQINLADQITFFLILVSHRMPNQIRQLNFNDTFLDFEHLKSCFPQYTVKVRLCCLNCDSLFYHSAQRFIVKLNKTFLRYFIFSVLLTILQNVSHLSSKTLRLSSFYISSSYVCA